LRPDCDYSIIVDKENGVGMWFSAAAVDEKAVDDGNDFAADGSRLGSFWQRRRLK
jgi:hypothetical protein